MLTLAEAITERARRSPEAIAFVDAATGETTSYAELDRRTGRMAGHLRKAYGVTGGERVAVLALNSVLTFELLLACSHLGAIVVPLNVRLSDHELAPVLDRCEPKVLFVDDAHAARLPGVPRQPLTHDATLGDAPAVRGEGKLDEPRVMLFTSGTTGKPKGALLSDRQIAANAASTAQAWHLTAADVALVDAPLFHTGGLNVLATPLLHLGGKVVVAARFDAVSSGETIVREGVTIAFGVPTMIERYLASGVVDRAKVRLWVTGGAPCPRSLLDAFAERGVTLIQGFGMTECGPNIFQPAPSGAPGTIGVPTAGIEMRLVDDDGKDVAPGTPGELLLRGPHLFAGYFRDDAATKAAIDADGWLHTGDVLTATPEGWFVAGRKKEMFISGGENVYPAEVEAAFMMHAGVAEAAVVSVPDPKWGEAGVAYVLPRDPTAAPTPDELRAFLRGRIAAYKVPRIIHVEPELPRTATNKIDKRLLAERAAGG